MSRRLNSWFVVAVVMAIAAATIAFVVIPHLPNKTSTVRLGDGVFRARVASTEADRVKGLSGVDRMAPDDALLMVFPNPGKWGIWMKDMKVSLDIIWLDENKSVIYIVKNASPEDSTFRTFTPRDPAKYVLEVPAGTVDSRAVTIGALASFEINGIGG